MQGPATENFVKFGDVLTWLELCLEVLDPGLAFGSSVQGQCVWFEELAIEYEFQMTKLRRRELNPGLPRDRRKY